MKKIKNSTVHHAQGTFKLHGQVDMELIGNTIFVHACGPFNVELMNALVALEGEFLTSLAKLGPFTEIVVFSGSVLASPEVMIGHAELLKMLKVSGLAHKASAYVIPKHLEGLAFMAPAAIKNYAAVDWPFAIFDNLETAQLWMREFS
ncbi:hypothetical protein [Undibacterium sp. Ren11W]|uniref:hypothetical protein n=1 Tax=Undibacterium sp. Ren11W TaxID=3413045 RepID=UPI003BEFFAAC